MVESHAEKPSLTEVTHTCLHTCEYSCINTNIYICGGREAEGDFKDEASAQ